MAKSRVPKVKLPKLARLNFAVSAQTKFLVLGIELPVLLFWLANWLVFTLPTKLAYITKFLKENDAAIAQVLPDYKTPAVYSDVLFKLNDNSGLLLVLLGIVLFGFGVALMLWMFKRYEMDATTLAQLNLRSIAVAVVVALVVLAMLSAFLTNTFILSFPDQLRQLFWV